MKVTFQDYLEHKSILDVNCDCVPQKGDLVRIDQTTYYATSVGYLFTPTGRGGNFNQEVVVFLEVAHP
jgi:hypothetical protein